MTLREDLIAAKALIADPKKWTRDEYEFDGCYCAMGALGKAILGDPEANKWTENGKFTAARDALARAIEGRSITTFNDALKTTHADIMAMFDRAIASA